jgi:hypothetical protein
MAAVIGRPRVVFALLLTLLLALALAPAPAGASEFEASARAGLSMAAGGGAKAAPAYGLSVRYEPTPRLRLEIGAERAVHSLASDAGQRVAAVSATAGVQAGLDSVPLVPFASAGVAFQYASLSDKRAAASFYGAYLGLGLRARIWRGLTLSGQVRYLTASFSADGFASYTSLLAEVGWAVP